MSSQANLGKIDRAARPRRRLRPVRLLLPLGWMLASIGYYGPWIAHQTAALTISGVDLGEFIKFLPGVLDGSLRAVRQLFYLPPFAVVVSIALLVGLRRLRYSWPVRALFLALAVPTSLQLLPPAWSPASLLSPEFRLQTIALGICWLLLAGFWLLGRLPAWFNGSLSGVLAVVAAGLSAWQFFVVKGALDAVYRTPPSIGWGFYLCVAGLAILAITCGMLVWRTRVGSRDLWAGE